jgi:hypothetical protein
MATAIGVQETMYITCLEDECFELVELLTENRRWSRRVVITEYVL